MEPADVDPEGLRILFLGPLKALVGKESCWIPCPAELSQEDLWSSLVASYPLLLTPARSVRFARNGEFLQAGEFLSPGDEIALIPPVSGG